MNIKDMDLSVALTGFHELSWNNTTVYCDGKNYIPPGLSHLQVDEVYLFKKVNEMHFATGMQYFVAFVQQVQQVQFKYQEHIFTLVSLMPNKIVLTDGNTESTITRINYTPVSINIDSYLN